MCYVPSSADGVVALSSSPVPLAVTASMTTRAGHVGLALLLIRYREQWHHPPMHPPLAHGCTAMHYYKMKSDTTDV